MILLLLNDVALLVVGYFLFTRYRREAKAVVKVHAKARVVEHETQLQELEDRWMGRLQKCDAILADSEAMQNMARASLARAQTEHQQINTLTHRVDTVLMDPRVRQALGQ
jgi:tRNA C32,U32 (ribose-2'-O)-methylase TrmJ